MTTTVYLPPETRPYLSIADAAELLDVSPRTIRRRIASGEIVAMRTSPERGHIRIPRAALLDYLERSRA